MGNIYTVSVDEKFNFIWGSEGFDDEFEIPLKIKKTDGRVLLYNKAQDSWVAFCARHDAHSNGYTLYQVEENVEVFGNYDLLTALPQQRTYWNLADQLFNNNEALYTMVAVDIEHFRFINKWYGREIGDTVLEKIGVYLHVLDSRYQTLSGYIGGDNFCIIYNSNLDILKELSNEISKILHSVEGTSNFKVNFGVYTPKSKMKAADIYDCCMNAIYSRGEGNYEGIYYFDESMEKELLNEVTLMPRVRDALKNDEFQIYLQPKCLLKNGKIVGAEALVRWVSQDGIIVPKNFVPALEKNGYITELDLRTWELTFKMLSKWLKRGMRVVPISVNVSRVDIYSLDVVGIFIDLATRYNVPPNLVEIEITESAYVDNEATIRDAERALKQAGFTILIDDFGSGYSSLNMLKDVDADILKLDMRFLDLTKENIEKGINIIKSVLDMAHELDLPSIAEGVEKADQLEILGLLGCEYAQGYYFYKPMPVVEFENLINDDDNVATARIRSRRVGKSYMSEITEYFWKVCEVNVITGEYHFIKNVKEPDYIAYPRPKDIGAYIDRYLENNLIHPDDVPYYKSMTDIAFIRKQIELGKEFMRFSLRYNLNNDGYVWMTFEIKKLDDFSDDNPIVLFTWKVADDVASVREDMRAILGLNYRAIVRYNLITKKNIVLNVQRGKAPREFKYLHLEDADVIRKSPLLHPSDREKFIKYVDNASLKQYFDFNDTPLTETYRHVAGDDYIKQEMEIRKSIDYTKTNPEVVILVRDVTETVNKKTKGNVRAPFIDHCLYNFEVNVSRDEITNNIDFASFLSETQLSEGSFSQLIEELSANFICDEFKGNFKEFMNNYRLKNCFNAGHLMQTFDYKRMYRGRIRWLRTQCYLYEQDGDVMVNIICSDITDGKLDELKITSGNSNILAQELTDANWKNEVYSVLYQSFKDPEKAIEEGLKLVLSRTGGNSCIIVRYDDNMFKDLCCFPKMSRYDEIISKNVISSLYFEIKEHKNQMLIHTKETNPSLFENLTFPVENYVTVPVYQQDKFAGYIAITNAVLDSLNKSLLEDITHMFLLSLVNREAYTIIHRMGLYDLLTGLKNRNSYESDLKEYATNYRALGCIYIDVNGLHELNNAEGHEAGDNMLKTVASELLDSFDRNKVYRIGGDEFVVFSSFTKEILNYKMKDVQKMLAVQNYAISFGIAYHEPLTDLNALINEAEHIMAVNKRDYYLHNTHNRRNR